MKNSNSVSPHPWRPFSTLPPAPAHVMCANTFPSPDQHHTTTTSPLLSNSPPTSPTAIAYFNVIGLLETTHTEQDLVSKHFVIFLLPKFLSIFTLKTCFWSHCRTQCVSSATARVKGTARSQTHQYPGQDCTSGRYNTARLSTDSAFTAKHQL